LGKEKGELRVEMKEEKMGFRKYFVILSCNFGKK
jgi:hypothetical protein